MSQSNSLNMLNICRICNKFSNFTINLSKMSNIQGFTLLAIFNKCTQLSATLEDEISAEICARCHIELELCYKFLMKVESSGNPLHSTQVNVPTLENQFEDDDATILLNNDMDTGIDPLEQNTKTVIIEPLTENLSDYEYNQCNTEIFNHKDNLSATNAEKMIFPLGHYICNICSKRYFTAKGLKMHMDMHLQLNSSGKKNKSLGSQVKQQFKDSHYNDKEEIAVALSPTDITMKKTKTKQKKMYPCKICGKLMISASKLRYHMVMHTGEKDYLCTICPKAYSTIYALKYHMRTHTGERPYECKFCGDKFLRPTTLKSHMRRHTGERPYGCNICGKRFIQHSSMTTHIKLNHMAKTIPCPHCNKKYARKTDLSTHLLSHTGDKPFSCALCPSRFIRQANLNKHMNQHHVSNKSTNLSKKSNKKSALYEGINEKTVNVDYLKDKSNLNISHENIEHNIVY